MIPDFVTMNGEAWKALPKGIHLATRLEVEERYAYNSRRQRLFSGFIRGATNLFQCGCQHIYLDGSFISETPYPNDFDCCWHEDGVSFGMLDLVFRDFDDDRAAQKRKYFGEFFPAGLIIPSSQITFLDFFQNSKNGNEKGIIKIENWIA